MLHSAAIGGERACRLVCHARWDWRTQLRGSAHIPGPASHGHQALDSDPVTLSRSVQWMGGRDVFQYLAVSIQFCYKGAGGSKSTQGFWPGKGAFHWAVPGCLLLRAWRSNKASTQAFQFGKNVQRLYVRAVSAVHVECRSGLGYGTALNGALWVGDSCVANVADDGSFSAPVCNSAALQRVCLETVLLRPMRSKRQVQDGVPKPYTMRGK